MVASVGTDEHHNGNVACKRGSSRTCPSPVLRLAQIVLREPVGSTRAQPMGSAE